jgi:integrase
MLAGRRIVGTPAMIRRASPTLGDFARDVYPLRRDIKESTHDQYLDSVRVFEKWAGAPIPLDTLDEDIVSRWLFAYSREAGPFTVKSKRSAILAIWRLAADEGLAQDPVTRRIRAARTPEQIIVAFTMAEVEQLLAACRNLKRPHKCGLPRPVWWDLAIRTAWDTGLRWGDVIRLRASHVQTDGTIVSGQSKTSKVNVGKLSETTMAVLRDTLAACPRDLVCPWPATAETFRQQFGRLVRKAGVRAGTWKWLRRASGTDVEAQQPGAGHEHLGNTERVFRRHYADRSIIGRRIPSPRPLPR